MLFPDDPVAEAPKLLDKVAHVFPPYEGGFVVGPIIELGWGSQAKIVEAKLGVVLALPDPMIIILGSVRVRAPSKVTPLTDFRCEIYGEITADRLLIIATLRDSKIAGIKVSGDLGLLIQWGGGGDFALSVGGFHPKYTERPDALKDLQRLTIDLSPPAVVKIVIKAYFAVTAGAVMAGVRGDLNADVGVASAQAWLQLDMIFLWAPRFGFSIDLDVGIEIEVFGCSFCSISFKRLARGYDAVAGRGHGHRRRLVPADLRPATSARSPGATTPPPIGPSVSPLSLVREALDEHESWKAVMPLDGDLLVSLGRVDVDGLVAHPLAALEVTQSRLPLETHIDRIGSAGVTANRVNLGVASTSRRSGGRGLDRHRAVLARPVPRARRGGAARPLRLRRPAERLPRRRRDHPGVGTASAGDVRWHTYFRDDDDEGTLLEFNPAMFAAVIVDHSVVGRAVAERDNPYLPEDGEGRAPTRRPRSPCWRPTRPPCTRRRRQRRARRPRRAERHRGRPGGRHRQPRVAPVRSPRSPWG